MTIPISELRINNLVWDEEENPGLITRIASPEIGLQIVVEHLHLPYEDQTTYKITEEVLAIPVFDPFFLSALGFYQPIYTAYWLLDTHRGLKFILHPDRLGYLYLKFKKIKPLIPVPVHGAHSVQNIYYALLGEELRVHL